MNWLSRLRPKKRVTPEPLAGDAPRFNLFANLADDWVLTDVARAVQRGARALSCQPVHHLEWEGLKRLPAFSEVDANFFVHYALYRDYLRANAPGRDVVFFTHFWPRSHEPAASEAERAEMLAVLRRARLIVSMSSHWKRVLAGWGVPEERIVVELVGADGERFTPAHGRLSGPRPTVGLVSGYKDNKNESFIRETVRRHPECDWVLLGRHWERSTLLRALAGQANFRYLDRPEYGYERWPEVYRTFDVFVSPSLVEGGPVPLLEAMLSGVWPIATRTGHAEDVIQDGDNGALFDAADAEGFDRRLSQALSRKPGPAAEVRSSVLHLTWDRFGAAVNRHIAALRAEAAR